MRYDSMRDQMMDALDQLAKADMDQAPNYRTMLRLRDRMVWEGVPGALADRVVASMKIAISARCFADEELMRAAVETVAQKAGELYVMVESDFPSDPESVFMAMARDFSLEMEF